MSEGVRRRDVIATGLASAGALALGPAFWREAFASIPARGGRGPYGPLLPPNSLGLALPEGFGSRMIARAGLPVAGTSYVWHGFPDGMATFEVPEGGFILVSNSETPAVVGGGTSAIRFDSRGRVTSAYRILSGTDINCAGGPTPWGTWLSCEEVDRGLVWECDPTGSSDAVDRPALGAFKHEAAAVDPRGKRVYLTEDEGDGGFYRFTPEAYPDLSKGLLEVAVVGEGGAVGWVPVPDPAAASMPTRKQVPEMTQFKRGEGIWFDSGTVYVATTRDVKVHAYSTNLERVEVVYDSAAVEGAPLEGVDNVTASRSGDLFICEDNGTGTLDIGLVTPEGEFTHFLSATGDAARGSELAGVTFDPSGERMFFSSQRAYGLGATYEITGPFRQERVRRAGPPRATSSVPSSAGRRSLLRRGVAVEVRADEAVEIVAALRVVVAAGRRRTLTRRTFKVPARSRRTIRLRVPESRRGLLGRKRAATVTVLVRRAGGASRLIRTHRVRITR